MYEIFNDENKLIFQVKRFVSYYGLYNQLITKKSFIKDSGANFFICEDLSILLMNNLSFLFDENKPQSFSNIRFEKYKLEELRIEILKDWTPIKEQINKITENIGLLKYETHENLRDAYHILRRLDNRAFELMDKIKEFSTSYYTISYSYEEF